MQRNSTVPVVIGLGIAWFGLLGGAAALSSGCRHEPDCCPIVLRPCETWNDGSSFTNADGERICRTTVNDGARVPSSGYITRYAEDGCPYVVPPPPDTPGITFCGGDPDVWPEDTRELLRESDAVEDEQTPDASVPDDDAFGDDGDIADAVDEGDASDGGDAPSESDTDDAGDSAEGSGADMDAGSGGGGE
jgi:hypothetical protein